jgi:hypothetical protein
MSDPVRPTFLRTSPPAELTPAAREIDAVADRLGFVDRQPVPTVRAKKRKTVEDPQCSFTMRISVRSANSFVAWTEGEGISYREGFDRLMAMLDVGGRLAGDPSPSAKAAVPNISP